MAQNDPGDSTAPATTDTAASSAARPPIDLDGVASYEDGDATVICDRQAPAAWVRSTVTVPVHR